MKQQNRNLDFLINPAFQGINCFFFKKKKLFVLSFENNGDRTSCRRHYLPLSEIMNYNIVIDGRNL